MTIVSEAVGVQMFLKWPVKIRPTLGLSISGTKHDRDKAIFSPERGGQSDYDEA